jgi:orotate phosphoribosyltransferase
MADLNGFLEGRIFGIGNTRRTGKEISSIDDVKRVLVVDDSVSSGRSILQIKERLAEIGSRIDFRFLAVYVAPGAEGFVDFGLEILTNPRVFQWNVMHHNFLENFCVDIDGVLCRDPDENENDDGEAYLSFLNTVEPKIIPKLPAGYLVTNRLERYRPETEAWLKRHGVQYKQLFMLDLPSKKERMQIAGYGSNKAKIYRDLPSSTLFIESDFQQALQIAQESGKPVLAYDVMRLVEPGLNNVSAFMYHSRTEANNLVQRLKGRAKRVLKRYARMGGGSVGPVVPKRT